MKQTDPEILFVDNDIIIVDKPSGVLSIPDRYKLDAMNLKKWLEQQFEKVFVVHRLDKDTSGVMVFARNAEAHRNLSLQFENHEIEKKYLAVVSSVLLNDDTDIDIPLMSDPRTPGRMIPSARGKKSLTHIHVLERFRVATLVECTLKTGRQHQLRVHCAAIGHPLLVDALYGRSENFLLSNLKRRYNLRKLEMEKPIISRATLHAHSLGFKHPGSGEVQIFTSTIPKDFKALLTVMRKYSAKYALPDERVFS